MKRPLGLWILLSAGILWLNSRDVHGARATSLIFGKSSTSTTTSTASPSDDKSESSDDEPDTTETAAEGTSNGTKPALTGIPQIDYIWDPNLPKELNGYNLSDYPFYERVPENITFKCDGLHDGFYASVLHKCQVYHHCLFGIRYDFLCANYTAFDQTLFNCNFVSNVDCKNSKNFWSRNDELYKTKPTEPPPALVYSYYTQAPPSGVIPSRRNPLLRRIPQPNVSPVQAETNPAAAPQPTHNPQGPLEVLTPQIPIEVPLAMMPRRRPSRLRPYYDYYYDYEEPQYYRRKRPRPRPYYDDEYDYYEDRYERRGDLRRRRPMRRYLSRRDKYEDEEYDEEYDELEDEEPRRKKTSRGGSAASASRNKPRRQSTRRPVSKTNRKQPDYYEEEYEDEPVNKKPASESSKNRPTNRRPTFEYDEEEDNPRGRRRDDDKTMIKPTSGTIFDRPRMAPKVNLPVPKNVADKYSYKAMNAKNKEPTEEYSSAVGKSTEKSTTPDNHDVTTMRGNFKRPYLTRRPASSNSHEGSTANRRTKSEDEIQVSKAVKQAAVRVKIPAEVAQKDSKRQPDRRTQSRINMYKSRHSLSTSEGQDADSEDLTEIEIDDSINEA